MQLDDGRVRDLSVFTAAELRPICLGVIGAVEEQLDVLARAREAQQLAVAAEAAHRARNEALIVGARELRDAFAALESAARAGEPARAHEAEQLVRELWPETRAAIAALGDQGASG